MLILVLLPSAPLVVTTKWSDLPMTMNWGDWLRFRLLLAVIVLISVLIIVIIFSLATIAFRLLTVLFIFFIDFGIFLAFLSWSVKCERILISVRLRSWLLLLCLMLERLNRGLFLVGLLFFLLFLRLLLFWFFLFWLLLLLLLL